MNSKWSKNQLSESILFRSGFTSGWCPICNAHILTHCYLSLVNALKRKVMLFICLFCFGFFPQSKASLSPVAFPTTSFSDFPSPKNSLYGGLLEKLFTSINKTYSSWFYLSPFYCFRLLLILAYTSTGTFQRRESKVIWKCIWTTSRNKSGDRL